tara:strand:+ start:2824 stop:3519 length:696 start_codon:yes stop_codon:yes gene_type:complete
LKNIISNKNNLQVLFEDNHIIAINKRCGDIVQGDKTGDKPLSEIVKSFIKTKYSKPGNVYLGIPHRLDRPTSGVVIFAKTSKSLSRLNKIFKDGKVQKYYWAVTKNNPEKQEDTLIHWLRKNEKTNKSTYFKKETVKAKKAVLHYRVLKKLERYFIIEIELVTGRHHQIRCQLSAIGCPVRGDLKYGYDRSNNDGGIDLHAKKIIFEHPINGKKIIIDAPVRDTKIWNATK